MQPLLPPSSKRLRPNRSATVTETLFPIAVLPVAPRAGEAAGRAIIQGRKSARGPDRLLAPLVLHQPDGSFTEAAERVLREGAAISI